MATNLKLCLQLVFCLSLIFSQKTEAQTQVPKTREVLTALTVGIRIESGGKCMGMFVAPKVVLTAAHCVRNGWPIRFTTLNGSSISRSAIAEVTIHPEFNSENIDLGMMEEMDIAYIVLKNDYWPNHLDFKQLKFSGLPKNAEEILAIAHPNYNKYKLKDAIIQQVPSKDQPNYVINFVVNEGASGGPLLAFKDGFVHVLAIVRNGAMKFKNDGDELLYLVTNDPQYIDVANSRVFYTDIDVGNGWLFQELKEKNLLLEQ